MYAGYRDIVPVAVDPDEIAEYRKKNRVLRNAVLITDTLHPAAVYAVKPAPEHRIMRNAKVIAVLLRKDALSYLIALEHLAHLFKISRPYALLLVIL